MHLNNNDTIIKKANRIISKYGTRDPKKLCTFLGIKIMEIPFTRQKGVYKVIAGNRYIFIKEDLDPVMHDIVIWHEIGHDQLHRKDMLIFQEFNLFDMKDSRIEYEANLFAAQLGLDDRETLDLIYMGKDVSAIAGELSSDINLVALKVSALASMGYDFRIPEYSNNFLYKKI